MNKLRTKTIFVTALSLCVLLLAVGTTLYFFTISQKNAVVLKNESLIASSTEDIVVLKQTIQRLDPQIKQIETYFIDHTNAVGFIERIEELAVLSGLAVDIQNIDVVEQTRKDRVQEGEEIKTVEVRAYGEMTMTVQVNGSWQGIMTFLATIESLNKKLTVSGLRLSASIDETSGATTWTGIFQLSGLTT